MGDGDGDGDGDGEGDGLGDGLSCGSCVEAGDGTSKQQTANSRQRGAMNRKKSRDDKRSVLDFMFSLDGFEGTLPPLRKSPWLFSSQR